MKCRYNTSMGKLAESRRTKRRRSRPVAGREWLDDLYVAFAGDAIFERAMKLGRQYRKSLRPASRTGTPWR